MTDRISSPGAIDDHIVKVFQCFIKYNGIFDQCKIDFDKLDPRQHINLALKLIDNEKINLFFYNFDIFSGLKSREQQLIIIEHLINIDKTLLLSNLYVFFDKVEKEQILELLRIKGKETKEIREIFSLSNFDLFKKMINYTRENYLRYNYNEEGTEHEPEFEFYQYESFILGNLEKYIPRSEQLELIKEAVMNNKIGFYEYMLIERFSREELQEIYNLYLLKPDSKEKIFEFIKGNRSFLWFSENLDILVSAFDDLESQKKIVNLVFRYYGIRTLGQTLQRFTLFFGDKESMLQLANGILLNHPEEFFRDESQQIFSSVMIDKDCCIRLLNGNSIGFYTLIIKNFDKFLGVIDDLEFQILFITRFIDNYLNQNSYNANTTSYFNILFEKLFKFNAVYSNVEAQTRIAKNLIPTYFYYLLSNLNKLPLVKDNKDSQLQIIDKMFDSSLHEIVIINIDKFTALSDDTEARKNIVRIIINLDSFTPIYSLIKHFKKFSELQNDRNIQFEIINSYFKAAAINKVEDAMSNLLNINIVDNSEVVKLYLNLLKIFPVTIISESMFFSLKKTVRNARDEEDIGELINDAINFYTLNASPAQKLTIVNVFFEALCEKKTSIV